MQCMTCRHSCRRPTSDKTWYCCVEGC